MITATFLGHQSWLLEASHGRCLIDPVVTRTFGNSPVARFEVWPPRVIDTAAMGSIDAIAFTSEHLDHFHLASLSILRSLVSVALVPPLFPAVTANALADLGYDVQRLDTRGALVGGLSVQPLVPSVEEVPAWEARCVPLLVRDTQDSSTVLIQSDTALPPGTGLSSDICVATNNSPRQPVGWEGTGLTNLLDTDKPDLELLLALSAYTTERLSACKWITYSGSGYRSIPRRHPPLRLADSREVARVLNDSSVESRFVGLAPGDRLSANGTVDRVSFVTEAAPLVGEPAQFVAPHPPDWSFPALLPCRDRQQDVATVLRGLHSLNRLLITSDFGAHLLDLNTRRGEPVPADRRFVIHARHEAGADIFTFDMGENKFRLADADLSLRDLIVECPTGMSVWLGDIAQIFEGTVQVWEVCSTACLQWYVDADPFLSPASFLHAALSEPIRPDLAATVYRNARSAGSGVS